MLLVRILLICAIIIAVESETNNTSVTKLTDIDNDGRVVEATNRIVGGDPVDIKSYPYMVSIQWRLGGSHHCGGSYILPRFVLSAAHCMVRHDGDNTWHPENPRFYVVLAGSSNLWYSPTWQIAVTDGIFPHPEYSVVTMANDIGLFRISKPLRLTPYVNYVPLPPAHDSELCRKDCNSCDVIGWGKTSEYSSVTSDMLRHVQLPVIPTSDCKRFFPQELHFSQICAGRLEGGVDACQGDSGGPLICNGTQIGIISWGLGCAAARSPGVYCRVDYFIDWIRITTRNHNAFSRASPATYPWLSVWFISLIMPLSLLQRDP